MLLRLQKFKQMYKLSRFKRILTFLTCSVITVSFISSYSGGEKTNNVQAKTISEIQQERKENEERIAALEGELGQISDDLVSEQEYQGYLSEQIELIQTNIGLLDKEVTQLNNDIAAAETNIGKLNMDIAAQQSQVDANIELFKERLCAMYVTGNDSLISAVLGSTDFYDMLSRVEMVNNIAAHDEELVNTLLEEVTTLENSKSALETEKLTLEMSKETREAKRTEMRSNMADLSEKMALSEAETDRLALEQERLNMSKDEIASENELLDAQEAEILEAIRIAEEKKAEEERLAEEQRKKDEAARRVREEEERRKAEDQAAQQITQSPEENNNDTPSEDNNSVNEDDNSNDEPSYEAVTPTASGFAWPCPASYYISSPFGWRWGRNHNGIDIGAGSGSSVCASKSGTVITVNNSCTHNYAKTSNCCGNGYGNYVIIAHDDGTQTLYGHLASASVSVGEYVSQGQVIGGVGSTGSSTGFHLHFEIYVGGAAVDPTTYVP